MRKNLPPDLIRVVDDDSSVCASLTFILQIAGFEVASYNSADQFLEQESDRRDGCLLLDVKMPGRSGLELFDEMKSRRMLLPVIFLTGHGDIEMAVQALHDGAFDFLVKPAEPEKLIEKVKKAVEHFLTIRSQDLEKQEVRMLMERLTPAETEVARLMTKGLAVKEIAQVLEVGEQAVKAHRSSIYRKLEVVNPVEVAAIVSEWQRTGQE